MPRALQDRPVLTFRQSYYMKAYRELSRSRNSDQGAGRPVPATEIESYCRLLRISDQQSIEDLFFFVGRLDQTYIEQMHLKMTQSNSKS